MFVTNIKYGSLLSICTCRATLEAGVPRRQWSGASARASISNLLRRILKFLDLDRWEMEWASSRSSHQQKYNSEKKKTQTRVRRVGEICGQRRRSWPRSRSCATGRSRTWAGSRGLCGSPARSNLLRCYWKVIGYFLRPSWISSLTLIGAVWTWWWSLCGREESAKSRSTCVGNSGEISLNHLVLPGVELDVDGLGANNSKEVCSKERKEDIVGCFARWW